MYDMRIVEESGGKAYLLDDEGRVVKAATSKSELLSSLKEASRPIAIGDRVEHDGKLAVVVSSVEHLYGTVFGLKYDGGEVASAFAEQLKHSDIEAPKSESAIDALIAEFEQFESSEADTLPEVKERLAQARSLNVRAKAMMTDKKLPLSEQVKVDSIVTATAVEIGDLKQVEAALIEDSEQEYLSSQPKWAFSDAVAGSAWSREDISWIEEVADELTEKAANTDWDTVLTKEAVALVDAIEDRWIRDDEVVEAHVEAKFRQLAAGLDAEASAARLAQFTQLVAEARLERVGYPGAAPYVDEQYDQPAPAGDFLESPDPLGPEAYGLEDDLAEGLDVGASPDDWMARAVFKSLPFDATFGGDGSIMITGPQGESYVVSVSPGGAGAAAPPVEAPVEPMPEPSAPAAPAPEEEELI